jgi:predicted glycosyltransferase
MRFLFYMGHPAHFHLFRPAIGILKSGGHGVKILIKKKDVLEDLVRSTGWDYVNINPRGRRDNLWSIGWQVLRRDAVLYRICRQFRPDVLFGTAVEIAHVGKLLRIRSVVLNEDDAAAIPLFARLAFPFAGVILSPHSANLGRWERRKTGYQGFHELAYLHPSYFTPDPAVGERLRDGAARYFILRLSAMGAHHDIGQKGFSPELARAVLERLLPHGRVYVSAERETGPAFSPYRMPLPPQAMHSALHYAGLYVGDSQTMAAEAAVLGTPSLRYSDFAGRLGYLEELEHKYKLAFAYPTSRPAALLEKIDELLADPGLKQTWLARREVLLAECADLTALLVQTALQGKTPC